MLHLSAPASACVTIAVGTIFTAKVRESLCVASM
jgi:hypothetical protein